MKIETPLFDAWRTRTKVRLESYGIKAELADYLASKYGRESRSWQRHIAAILNGERLANAEIVLAVDGWLDRREKSDGKAGRKSRRA